MKKEKIIGLEDRLFMIQELMLGSVVFNIGVSHNRKPYYPFFYKYD